MDGILIFHYKFYNNNYEIIHLEALKKILKILIFTQIILFSKKNH